MLVPPQYSNVQKREVTTYLVTPRDRGTLHCSIQQAIDKADPYSRILLASGQYFESITLQQPLELVGEEGSEMPEVVTRGVCLSLLGDVETYIENVKFTTKTSQFGKSAPAHRAAVGMSAIRVTGGRPTFHRCHMTSAFFGGESHPTMTECTISGNVGGSGLIIAEAAGGEFTENTICNHLPYALHVKSRGTPIFTKNSIYQEPKAIQSMLGGLLYVDRHGGAVLISQDNMDSDDVTRSIAPRFLSNRIGDEVRTGFPSSTTMLGMIDPDVVYNGDFEQLGVERRTVVVECGCSPYFEENTITGGHVCVALMTGSSGHFTNNTMAHASVAGLVGGVQSTTTVRFNTISHCATGVFVMNSSTTLTQNSIKENVGTGLLLLIGADDKFFMEGNSFVGNDVGISVRPNVNQPVSRYATTVTQPPPSKGAAGIGLLTSASSRSAASNEMLIAARGGNPGEAHLEKNYVCMNRSVGILCIGEGYRLTLDSIEISGNGQYGTLVSFGATPLIRGVRYEKGPYGIVIEQSACPRVEGCHFQTHTEASILVRNRGKGDICENDVTGFGRVGIMVNDGGNPEIHHNKLMSNSGTGILVTEGGSGRIHHNSIDMMQTGIAVSSFGDPIITQNSISSCTESGVVVTDEGCGCILQNTILSCAIGVMVSHGGECVVRGNNIKSSSRFGIVCSEGSRALIEKNMVDGSVAGNILLDGADSRSLVKGNTAVNSSGFGIHSAREALGEVTGNFVSGNRDGGLCCEASGGSVFRNNTCVRERGPGICVKALGKSTFEGNSVSEGYSYGVVLHERSVAVLRHCNVFENESGGVLLHSNAGGSVTHSTVRGNRGPGLEFFGLHCSVHTHITDLDICSNSEEGIRAQDSASGKIQHCTIRSHETGAVLRNTGALYLDACTFSGNAVGLQFLKRGSSVCSNSTFHTQSEADVVFVDEGRGTVSKCTMGNGSRVSVLGSFHGGGQVTECTIAGCIEAGVKFIKGSYTVVTKSSIDKCVAFGVLCDDMSSGVVAQCTITGSAQANVKLCPRSSPVILKNSISHSGGSGVVVESRFGRLESNHIFENALHGVSFEGIRDDSPRFENSFLSPNSAGSPGRRNKSPSMAVSLSSKRRSPSEASLEVSTLGSNGGLDVAPQSSDITLAKNKISANSNSGIFFGNGTSATLQDNEVVDNVEYGSVISAGATPEFEAGNKIKHNALGGVWFKASCSPSFRKSTISENAPWNILLEERSSGVLESCEIFDGAVDGIRAADSLAQIRKCRISGCMNGAGIVLMAPNKHLVISDNEVLHNACGLAADVPGAFARVTRNRFAQNTICGVKIENGGCPEIIENRFEVGTCGVLLRDGAGGSVVQNRFIRNAEGILISGGSISTTCQDNAFEENDKSMVLRNTEAFCVERSVFGPSESAAVSCEEGARGTIRENKFINGHRGVLVSATAAPLIVNNHFLQVKIGVEITGRSAPRIEKNVFSGCDIGCRTSSSGTGILVSTNAFVGSSVGGVLSEKQSFPSVTRNVFADCNSTPSSAAVVVSDLGSGSFVENDMHNNSIGICSSHSGSGEFSRCMIHDNKVGCQFESSAQTVLDKCTMFSNTVGDMVSRSGAVPSIRNSFFSKSPVAVLFLGGGGGTCTGCSFRDTPAAIIIEDAGSAVVTNSFLSNCAIAITLRKASSRGCVVSRNVITQCETAVLAQAMGSANVTQNFISSCESAVVIERRSQLKLNNNTISKVAKYGIVVRGNGNITISNNIVTDCAMAGMQIAIASEKQAQGGAGVEDGIPTNIVENFFSGSRVNVQILSGDAVMRKNHIQRGDFGLTVLPEARAVIDGNAIYDCVRASFTLGSRFCHITNNLFYSLSDGGAFETSHDASPILSKDNGVYNSCSCKLAPPPTQAPAKVTDLEVGRNKDILSSLQTALLSLHTTEIPDYVPLGCCAIPGSLDRKLPVVDEQEESDRQGAPLDRRKSVARMASFTKRRKSAILSMSRSGSVISAADSPATPLSLPPVPPPRQAATARRPSKTR